MPDTALQSNSNEGLAAAELNARYLALAYVLAA